MNCYDGTHTREQLKQWSKKKILLCPACGKPYEYCHGRIVDPYFRHADKTECESYSEPETNEHMQGKIDLYEWIKKQKGVRDVVLEGWIPETKQRPDIMFTYRNELWVIEYQCSPIATEYVERHELYQTAGIHDIWICGTEKYFQKNMREKYLETAAVGFYDSKEKNFIPIDYNYLFVGKTLKISHYYHNHCYFRGSNLKDYYFSNGHIYNVYLGNPDVIFEKRKRRKMVSKTYDLRESNEFLNRQLNRIFSVLQSNLANFSNENWNFHVETTHSKYKVFKYIVAIPRILEDREVTYFASIHFEDHLEKIKLYNMSFEEYQNCRNPEYLKNLLRPIMKKNINTLLQYHHRDLRFLEVTHE
nr:competence protein CoiA family protein [Clostridium sp. Marseille-P7770]